MPHIQAENVQKIVFLPKHSRRAFLKRPENFSGPETVPQTVPQSSRNDFWVFLKAPENF